MAQVPEEKYGVHASHCCEEHGCKYGNPDCPVTNGKVKQEYKCESCYTEEEEIRSMDDKSLQRFYRQICAENSRRLQIKTNKKLCGK